MQAFDDERLSAYLDGELDELEAVRLERDLQQNAELRSALTELRSARAWIQRDGPANAPASLFDKVMDEVQRDAHQTQRHAWWRRPFGLPAEAFAMAAVAIIVLYAALPDPPPTTSDEVELMPGVRLEQGDVGAGIAPVYMAPDGWIVALPKEGGLELLRQATAASAGSFVTPGGEPMDRAPGFGSSYVRMAAPNAALLENALRDGGATLTPIGVPHEVTGFVRIRLEVRVSAQ
jgi:hypothetical protein